VITASEAIQEAADVLTLLGSLRPVNTLDDRDCLVQDAVNYYITGRIAPAVDQ